MLNENELIINLSPNYSEGRGGTPVRHITFHHIVGPVSSAIARFSNPANQVSTHFAVGADGVYCFVDTDNTAWGNGDWNSNLESVSIEHEGDWRNGYRNEAVIANSARLVAWLISLYPDATPTRHRDIIATACPGDLPVEEIWSKALEILHPTAPAPAPKLYWRVKDAAGKQLAAYGSLQNAIAGWNQRGSDYSIRITDPSGQDVTPAQVIVPSPQPTPEPAPLPSPEPPAPDPTPVDPPADPGQGSAYLVIFIQWLLNLIRKIFK